MLRRPRYDVRGSCADMGHSTVSTPNTNVECDGLFETLSRWSTKHFSHVFGCPTSFKLAPPVTVVNINRLGNWLSLCRATSPAETSRRTRMVVSMLSHRVFLRTFAYQTVAAILLAFSASASQSDSVVFQPEPGEVFRPYDPRHSLAQQSFNHPVTCTYS